MGLQRRDSLQLVRDIDSEQLWIDIDVSVAVEFPTFGHLSVVFDWAIQIGVGFCRDNTVHSLMFGDAGQWGAEEHILVGIAD